jgi:hypothetical protein
MNYSGLTEAVDLSQIRTRIEPPLEQWRLNNCPGSPTDRAGLVEAAAAHARKLRSAPLDNPGRIVATGHQAWLWHPGILAKDMAMRAAADRLDAAAVHLVVDHDAHEALHLAVPIRRGDSLEMQVLQLAEHNAAAPTGWQGPTDVAHIQRVLANAGADNDELTVQLAPVVDAFSDLPPCRTLAEQLAAVLVRLMQPYVGPTALLMSSDLIKLPVFHDLVTEMTADGQRCATAYNDAARCYPEARIAALSVKPNRVELPLWALAWDKPRQRVFVDTSDSVPQLSLSDGQPIDLHEYDLAPRALLLTAVMRSALCDLFIHGSGGKEYDKVTSQWWSQWRGEALGPATMVSSDVYLDLAVPVADRREVVSAKWYRHHLPHNIDRVLQLGGAAAMEKQQLLKHMHDDRHRPRRRQAFEKIQRINGDLARAYPHLLTEADQRLEQARMGMANRRVASKRDWCFALYPPHKLLALRQAIGRTIQP